MCTDVCVPKHLFLSRKHASKVMLKILQARLKQYTELPDVQAGFGKAEEPDIKLPTSIGSSKKKKRVTEKPLLLLYLK